MYSYFYSYTVQINTTKTETSNPQKQIIMKVTFDLENNVTIGKNLMDYVQGSIKNLAMLMGIDCNIEIVNYQTREDTQEDINLFEIIDVVHEQVIHTFEKENSETPIPPTPYKC